MMMIGCDYHPSMQQIAWVDTGSGDLLDTLAVVALVAGAEAGGEQQPGDHGRKLTACELTSLDLIRDLSLCQQSCPG